MNVTGSTEESKCFDGRDAQRRREVVEFDELREGV